MVSKQFARSLKKILEYRITLGVDGTVVGVVERRLVFEPVEKLRDVVVDHVMNDSIKKIVHVLNKLYISDNVIKNFKNIF